MEREIDKAVNTAWTRMRCSVKGSDDWQRPYSKKELVAYDLRFEINRPWITDGVRRMVREVQWLLNDMAHADVVEPRWLTLCSPSGSGKTHLALRIRDIAREQLRFRRCQRWTVTRYAEMLRNGHWDLQAQLEGLDVLVLDDLGAERTTDMIRASLYDLLNSRLGKWTVITSNLNLEQIAEGMDARLASRMLRGGSVVVESDEAMDYALESQRAGECGIMRRAGVRRKTEPKPMTESERLEVMAMWREVMGETFQGEQNVLE